MSFKQQEWHGETCLEDQQLALWMQFLLMKVGLVERHLKGGSLNSSKSNLCELTVLQVNIWTKVHFIGHSLKDQSLFSP